MLGLINFILSTVGKWFAKIERGEMGTEDDARDERPKKKQRSLQNIF